MNESNASNAATPRAGRRVRDTDAHAALRDSARRPVVTYNERQRGRWNARHAVIALGVVAALVVASQRVDAVIAFVAGVL